MFFRSILIFFEVLVITLMNYYMASSYFSLDVLYCLPVIQTARLPSLHSESGSGSYTLIFVSILCAAAWSAAEAFVVWPAFPMSAVVMNVLTRAITFIIIARVIAKLWKDKELERKDYLTGLANRDAMTTKLEDLQLVSDASRNPFSLIYINIDRFKSFNDEFGYKAGDDVLKLLANTLTEKTKYEDMVARIASDEFLILLHDTDEPLSNRMATRLCTAVINAFVENGWTLNLSFGCVTKDDNSGSVEELVRIAGERMRRNRAIARHQESDTLGS